MSVISDQSVHIIGRGIVGLSIAYELVRRGWKVTVLGIPNLLGEASRAAVGVSSLKGHIQPTQPLFYAKMRGHEYLSHWLKQIEKDSQVSIDKIQTGVLEPFFDVEGFKHLSERVFHGKFRGCLRSRLIAKSPFNDSNQKFLKILPRGFFCYPGDLWFDPVQTLDAMEKALVKLGCTVRGFRVACIKPRGRNSYHIEGSESEGSHTNVDNTEIMASHVVLAAGAFTDQLLQNSQLPSLNFSYTPGETIVGSSCFQREISLRIGKANFVSYGGSFRWGSSSRNAGALERELRLGPSQERVKELVSQAESFFYDSFVPLSSLNTRWGIRSRVRDRAPVVGPLFWPGLRSHKVWIASGFYKNGLQLSGILASYVANLITGAPLSSWQETVLAPLVSIDRKSLLQGKP